MEEAEAVVLPTAKVCMMHVLHLLDPDFLQTMILIVKLLTAACGLWKAIKGIYDSLSRKHRRRSDRPSRGSPGADPDEGKAKTRDDS